MVGTVHLLIVAKAPLPGRAKTRLMGRFGAEGAAALAAASLADTFDAAARCRADRVVVAFDGDPSGIVPEAFEVIPQRAGDLANRLAGAWADAGGPGLQIGMDTPQVGGAALDRAFDTLEQPGTDAVLGLATDGGWWAIGLRQPVPGLFADIPTSRDDTGARQLQRLADLGLRTSMLESVTDVDTPHDVDEVAELVPFSRFARVLGQLRADDPREPTLAPTPIGAIGR